MPITQITTKDKVKLLLGITASTEDSLFEMLCDWVTARIESHCQKIFTERTITDDIYNSQDFKFSFFLDNTPVKSITEFKQKISKDNWKTLVEDTDYEINKTTGFIRVYEMNSGIADIKLTYVVGGNAVPKDLEMLATELVARLYKKRDSEGVSQESMAEASVQWGGLLTDEDKIILNHYKRFTSFIA